MKNKPYPALLQPSNLSNEIKKRVPKSRESLPLRHFGKLCSSASDSDPDPDPYSECGSGSRKGKKIKNEGKNKAKKHIY
jgi:hypothetical protein